MMPTLQLGQAGRAGGRAAAASGWAAGFADPLWSFSNLQLVGAAGLGLMSRYSIGSIRANSAGKRYVEVRFDYSVGYGSGVRHDVGLTRDFPPDSTPVIHGHGWRRNGNLYVDSVSTVSASSIASGDIVCIAADLSAGEAWYALNGGSWIGGGDPATGTSPSLSGLPTGVPWYVGACKETGVELTTFTLYGQAALLNYTPPSGFLPWAE